jgi:glycosyltransferase involved in cell wall biosynthesis
MKIAIAHHYSLTFYSGGEKIILSAAKLLSERHKVEIYALPIRRRQVNLKIDVPYQEGWFHNIDADVVYVIYVPTVHALFKSEAPRIAGIHGFIAAEQLCAKEAVPLNLLKFISHHGTIATLAHYNFKLFGKYELSKFEAIHVVNRLSIKDYVHLNKVFYIPNWVDSDVYKPTTDKADKFTVLFIGRRTWAKGFDLFLEACKILIEKGYKFNFISTGESHGPIHGLRFVNETELPKVYSKAHCVVYPSRIDTFGLVILESLACGTPVITSPTPAHMSLDLPLFYASKPWEIAQRIVEVFYLWERSDREYDELCTNARKAALRYNIKNVFPKFEAMLTTVAEEAKMRSKKC